MSRSNPTTDNPNPSTRWMSWSGSEGTLSYFDKAAKEEVSIGSDFTFLLLDVLNSVTGWHEPSESRIYSNEIRDTRTDTFAVKSFKGGELLQGLYKDIRDRVSSIGGKFNSNLYVAYKDGDELKIGTISFSGAALGVWMDFSKENRSDLYKKAIRINGFTDGKKGAVKFRTPKFFLVDTTPETDEKAQTLDKVLQEYMKDYLAKPRSVAQNVEDHSGFDPEPPAPEDIDWESEADQVPF